MLSPFSSDSNLIPDLAASPAEKADLFVPLYSRPSRPPDYQAENHALAVLASTLADDPDNILQKLVVTALVYCRADTAGISLLENRDGEEVFRWVALAGAYAAARNFTMRRSESPCGVCIENNAPTLMYLVDRHFPALPKSPRFIEVLLVPLRNQGQPIGTVWVVMHQFNRKFDREDERLLGRLANFASAGWQLRQAHLTLEQRVKERTDQLARLNAALHKTIEDRRRVNEERRSLLRRLAVAEEEERGRLALELHDDLAQRAAFLEIELELISQTPPSDPAQVTARLEPLTRQVGRIANDLRELSHRLHPSIIEDLGLEPALRDLVREFARSGCNVLFVGAPLSRPVELPVATALYRITQAALWNAAKHAPDANITVTLSETDEDLQVTIDDDGPGFDPRASGNNRGLGLLSMQERAQTVGGELVLESKIGEGTEVRASVPWQVE
jgi:signal transduction histidine kinase